MRLTILFILALSPSFPILASNTPPPESVTISGTLQSVLGCLDDWQPGCSKTFLIYDPIADLWIGTFDIPAGKYEYKVTLNKSWDENYGGKADRNGANVSLELSEAQEVTFIYDHKTHLVVNSKSSLTPVVIGNFQSELGCKGDNATDCLAGFMSDPEFDGIYSFTTKKIPPGAYEALVAASSTGEIYGEGGAKGGPPIKFTVAAKDSDVYFGFDPATKMLTISTEGAPKGNIGKQRAHWMKKDTLLWDVPASAGSTFALHYSPDAKLKLGPRGITGGTVISLTRSTTGGNSTLFDTYPHLIGLTVLKVAPSDQGKVAAALKGQVAVEARDDKGQLTDTSGVQIAGVLDDLYVTKAATATLGPSFANDGKPTLAVWAPTARAVSLHLFDDASADKKQVVPMKLDPASGVWSVTGESSWKNKYYLYEVEVYVPAIGKIEKNLVTDPYSLGLSLNSQRSQIVDLNAPDLMPAGWDTLKKPSLAAPEDAVIYELHVRDFSSRDGNVPEDLRGTFAAFSQPDSAGMKHLQALADVGLTHVHLLPAFDIASVNENKAEWKLPDYAALSKLPLDSEEQQKLVAQTQDQDGFNWGYDPYHYTTPEGSYSTDPDGPRRIIEFREMVKALNEAGLRVVMDVVYNHTSQSGQSEKSVLDKIVPGYYYRLNNEGAIETSTCCQNTATEHAMMEKLMIDSVLTWAKQYKVDGFRFDLMGHHMLRNMNKLRAALNALTVEKDGVDGKSIIVYGEGWDFGEVANNKRGINASQLNLAESGIGSFNDRLRDAARGGSPFDDRRIQGFITGLGTAPNGAPGLGSGDAASQLSKLISQLKWIRLGLAGNLRDYELPVEGRRTVRGDAITYNGKPAGYAADPQETVNYVSAHDNEALFDKIQWAAPISATMADRVRMNNLGVSLVMLGQGIPFFHAGDDLLRSKSLDRDSYNSGDWFNALDFTYATNNWGIGLPPTGPNKDRWELMKPLLGDPKLKPSSADIQRARDHFLDMLRIRKSSPLFRLQTAEQIKNRVTFGNVDLDQIPGLIVMRISDEGKSEQLDPQFEQIVVAVNASPQTLAFTEPSVEGAKFELHPIQGTSKDSLVKQSRFDTAKGEFRVPGRTTAVFVVKR